VNGLLNQRSSWKDGKPAFMKYSESDNVSETNMQKM